MPGEGACFLALFLNAQRRIRIRAHFGLDRYADHVLHVVHVSDMMMHRSPRSQEVHADASRVWAAPAAAAPSLFVGGAQLVDEAP